MILPDTGLRRDWVFALARLSTSAGLTARAALARALPRRAMLVDAGGGTAELEQVADRAVWRCETEGGLYSAAAEALEAAEDELRQLIAAAGAVMALPPRPAEMPEPAAEPIAA
jgi:hypothetical protein